ncbi:MAG: hypothetical protein ACOCXG_05860 [Nanoarchaeota archaeon]
MNNKLLIAFMMILGLLLAGCSQNSNIVEVKDYGNDSDSFVNKSNVGEVEVENISEDRNKTSKLVEDVSVSNQTNKTNNVMVEENQTIENDSLFNETQINVSENVEVNSSSVQNSQENTTIQNQTEVSNGTQEINLGDIEIEFILKENSTEKVVFEYEIKGIDNLDIGVVNLIHSDAKNVLVNEDLSPNSDIVEGALGSLSGEFVDEYYLAEGDNFYAIAVLTSQYDYVISKNINVYIPSEVEVPEPTYSYNVTCSDYDCFIQNVENNVNVKMNWEESVDWFGIIITGNTDYYFEVLSDTHYAFRQDLISQSFDVSDENINAIRNESVEYQNMTNQEIKDLMLVDVEQTLLIQDCIFEDKNSFISALNKWNSRSFSTEDLNFADCEITMK